MWGLPAACASIYCASMTMPPPPTRVKTPRPPPSPPSGESASPRASKAKAQMIAGRGTTKYCLIRRAVVGNEHGGPGTTAKMPVFDPVCSVVGNEDVPSRERRSCG